MLICRLYAIIINNTDLINCSIILYKYYTYGLSVIYYNYTGNLLLFICILYEYNFFIIPT